MENNMSIQVSQSQCAKVDNPHTLASNHQWIKSILGSIPNIVVFSMLIGVLALGHHTGWKMPKFSVLTGTAPNIADDWCAEHLVPQSQCIECNDGLLPKSQVFGFCAEHGVAECVLHHPELAQVGNDPKLPRYDTARAISVMDRPENNSRDTFPSRRIQFTSTESVAKAGVDVDVVGESSMSDFITSDAELIFDPSRVGILSSKASGTIAAVYKKEGDRVSSGEILALIDAAVVGQLKTEFVQHTVQYRLRKDTVQRLESIAAGGAIAGKNMTEAEAALQESKVSVLSTRQLLANLGLNVPDESETLDPQALMMRLEFLGLPSHLIDSLPPGTKNANLVPIISPHDGVLVSSEAVVGTVVEASRPLMTVSDPAKLWLVVNVRQEDAKYIRINLPVRFRSDGGDQQAEGTISWISPSVDPKTRTLKARVEIDNSDGRLLGKTFGVSRIILREEPHAVVVPHEAVQSTQDAHYVFVRDKNYFDENSPRVFHVRQVRLGAENNGFVELLAGALPGEVVAVKGSNVLLAHLLRGNLGAGCGCHEN